MVALKITKGLLRSKKFLYFIGAIILYFLVKNVFETPDKRESTNPLTNDEANRISDLLLLAMDKSGTDEDKILELLIPLNADSFNQVYNSFGNVRFVSFLGGHKSLMPWDNELNLLQWFDQELNNSDKAEIQNKLNFKLF
jgi:hypothetical protein